MGIQFNLTIEDPVKREIFRDKRIRIAFSHAIDRDEINEATQFGLATPMQATVHRMTPWFKKEYAHTWAPPVVELVVDYGGYGDPRERDPELVRADVRNGLLSPERARDMYGVDTEELKWQTTARSS